MTSLARLSAEPNDLSFRVCSTVRSALLLVFMLLQIGCSSGPQTSLNLYSDGKISGNYIFNQTLWRSSSAAPGSVEVVGYGLIPYNNGPMSPTYNSQWAPSGWITFYVHLVPQPDGSYALTILGPSSAIGPGDNEVLTGTIEHPQFAPPAKGDVRTITFSGVAIHSRNFPAKPFTMSGTIIAKPGRQGEFEREVHTVELQLSWRGPAPTSAP